MLNDYKKQSFITEAQVRLIFVQDLKYHGD